VVRIDVLAGTSAGGLNSVLLATSVKYGVDFDAFRDLWLDVADVRKLVRGTDEPNPQSLLKGDAHFLVTLRDVLERCLADRAPNSSYVDLSVTGTILDAIGKPSLDDLGTPALEPSHPALDGGEGGPDL
jgi:predicted acylesterase/phospholipase RssA